MDHQLALYLNQLVEGLNTISEKLDKLADIMLEEDPEYDQEEKDGPKIEQS